MDLLVWIVLIVGAALLLSKKKHRSKGIFALLPLAFLALSFLSGCDSSQPKGDTSSAAEKKTEKSEKLKLDSARTFTTSDNGMLSVKGNTLPNTKVRLIIPKKEPQLTVSDDEGEYEFLISEFPEEKANATIIVTKDGEDSSKKIVLKQSNAYKAQVAKEKERSKAVAIQKDDKDQTQKADKMQKVDEKSKKAVRKRPSYPKLRPTPPPKKQASQNDKKSERVYITATGKKYHYSRSCPGLNHSKGEITTTKAQAEKQGYTLCKRG